MRSLVPVLLISTLFACAAQAMPIERYDKMAWPDQKEYVLDLVDGAQKVLRDAGRAADAEKAARLFITKDPQSNISIGVTQFEVLLARARVADLNRLKKDPKAARLEVEHAMMLTLKKNGIDLPPAFMQVNSAFRPKLPPR